jgi:hypothetical protein
MVTMLVNILRGHGAEHMRRKTTCPRGHEYYEKRNVNGARICRICANAVQRRLRAERSGA